MTIIQVRRMRDIPGNVYAAYTASDTGIAEKYRERYGAVPETAYQFGKMVYVPVTDRQQQLAKRVHSV